MMTKKQIEETIKEMQKLRLSEKNKKRLDILIKMGKLYLKYKYGVTV